MLLVNDGDRGRRTAGASRVATGRLPRSSLATRMSELVRLNAQVAPTTRDAWNAFASEHGLTVSALVEVIGLRLAEGKMVVIDDELIEDARREMAERLKRRRLEE